MVVTFNVIAVRILYSLMDPTRFHLFWSHSSEMGHTDPVIRHDDTFHHSTNMSHCFKQHLLMPFKMVTSAV